MVYFVLTRTGYDDLAVRLAQITSPLWINGGVLSPNEFQLLRQSNFDVSHFTNRIDPLDPAAVSLAVETIQDHHPDKVIWIEHVDGPA